jgi:hypothetical protein
MTKSKKSKSLNPIQVGNNVFLRTVTHYLTGHVAEVSDDGNEIVLTDAAWIADTGRHAEMVKSGKLNEVEPYMDPVMVNRSTIVDCTIWRHKLPREVV